MTQAHHIYLIQLREFINSGEAIYKIGGSAQKPGDRMSSYPKDSVLLLMQLCLNWRPVERNLMVIFKRYFKQREDIGTEYFEGNPADMIMIIVKECMKEFNDIPFITYTTPHIKLLEKYKFLIVQLDAEWKLIDSPHILRTYSNKKPLIVELKYHEHLFLRDGNLYLYDFLNKSKTILTDANNVYIERYNTSQFIRFNKSNKEINKFMNIFMNTDAVLEFKEFAYSLFVSNSGASLTDYDADGDEITVTCSSIIDTIVNTCFSNSLIIRGCDVDVGSYDEGEPLAAAIKKHKLHYADIGCPVNDYNYSKNSDSSLRRVLIDKCKTLQIKHCINYFPNSQELYNIKYNPARALNYALSRGHKVQSLNELFNDADFISKVLTWLITR